jgi:hypothetical protein
MTEILEAASDQLNCKSLGTHKFLSIWSVWSFINCSEELPWNVKTGVFRGLQDIVMASPWL